MLKLISVRQTELCESRDEIRRFALKSSKVDRETLELVRSKMAPWRSSGIKYGKELKSDDFPVMETLRFCKRTVLSTIVSTSIVSSNDSVLQKSDGQFVMYESNSGIAETKVLKSKLK